MACLEAKANVCCVKFNPESRYHLSFGSAGKYLALPIPSNCLIPWVTFRADFMFTLVFLFLLKCVAVMLCFLDFCTMNDLSRMNFTGS